MGIQLDAFYITSLPSGFMQEAYSSYNLLDLLCNLPLKIGNMLHAF